MATEPNTILCRLSGKDMSLEKEPLSEGHATSQMFLCVRNGDLGISVVNDIRQKD